MNKESERLKNLREHGSLGDRATAPSPSLGEPETLEHVHITDKQACITGDPADLPDSVADDDARRHNCDQMGCPTLDHVLYRLPFTDHRKPIDVKALARTLAESIDFTAGPVQAREAFEKWLDVLVIPASPTAAGQKAVALNYALTPLEQFADGIRAGRTGKLDRATMATALETIIEACQKRLFASPVPASGWVMVPREPTKEMLEAAQSCRLYTEEDGSDWRNSDATWRAMLAAIAVGEAK